MRHFPALRGALLILLLTVAFRPGARGQTQTGPSTSFSANAPAGGDTTNSSDVGAGIFGTLPFKLTFNVRGGYDDNVTTSNQFKEGSPFTNTGVAANYDFGDSRTRLSLQVGAGFTYYYDDIHVPGVSSHQYDIDTSLKLAVTHKASARLTLSMDAYVAYLSEPDFTIAQGINSRAGNYFFTQDKFTANYLWSPRFATATSYTLGALHYDDDIVGSFENRWENTFGNEFRFLLAPTTTLVAEYRFELVTYQNASLNSQTHFALAGFDHSFDPRLTVSVRGGAEFRDYESDGNTTGPYFEGTLNYSVAKQTTVSWTNRYGIEEPDALLSQGRNTFRTGISAKHDFTPKISATLGVYYEHDDYQPFTQSGFTIPGFTEQDADVAFSVRYSITRYFALEAGYNYTDVWSDIASREYTRNRYWGGLSVTF
jgi:hypothetical protein